MSLISSSSWVVHHSLREALNRDLHQRVLPKKTLTRTRIQLLQRQYEIRRRGSEEGNILRGDVIVRQLLQKLPSKRRGNNRESYLRADHNSPTNQFVPR